MSVDWGNYKAVIKASRLYSFLRRKYFDNPFKKDLDIKHYLYWLLEFLEDQTKYTYLLNSEHLLIHIYTKRGAEHKGYVCAGDGFRFGGNMEKRISRKRITSELRKEVTKKKKEKAEVRDTGEFMSFETKNYTYQIWYFVHKRSYAVKDYYIFEFPKDLFKFEKSGGDVIDYLLDRVI